MRIHKVRGGRLALAAGLIVVACVANAAFDFNGWSWRSTIETGNASGFVRLDVTPEVFDRSQPSLNDLRVLDATNNLVPFVIRWDRTPQQEKREPRPVKMLNPTYESGKFSRVTLDFGSPVEKSQVRVGLSGNNYRRAASLEGSTDSLNWEKIPDEFWLFDVSLPDKSYRFDTLNFPTNNFRYMRLTVSNMPDDPRRITIDSADASFTVQTSSTLTPLAAKLIGARQDEKTHESIFEFDLGYRNLPVAAVGFEFADPWFHRGYDLLGRNSTTESVSIRGESETRSREQETPWEGVRSGILYKIVDKDRTSESTRVTDISASYRYLQLRVQNGDNPQLKLNAGTAYLANVALVFDCRTGQAPYLIGGNPGCNAPDYDLANALPNLDAKRKPTVKLGPFEALKQVQVLEPWTERHGNLIWVALIVAAAGMIGMILKNLRQTPSE